MRTRRLHLVVPAAGLLLAALACAGAPAPEEAKQAPAETAPAQGGSGGTLLELADAARERGELELAAGRYRRVLAAQPRSAGARVGLGEIALLRGDLDTARRELEAAHAAEPGSAQPLVALARLAQREGRRDEALQRLEQALEREPGRPDAHAQAEELTGAAPRAAPASDADALALARAHPYDPRALVRAAFAAERASGAAAALPLLERAVWLGDRDPAAAQEAIAKLRALDPAWAERRVVLVHAAADEPLRRAPGWRFQLRSLLLWASHALDAVLATAFVPASLGDFDSGAAGGDLRAILDAATRGADDPPRPGLFAAFTGKLVPAAPGRYEAGVAEFLGRRMAVRLGPAERESRVLVHEILHLYGAIHVLPTVSSLMNPSGGELVLDSLNADIARAVRARRFGLGGFDQSVLARVDLEQTTAAFVSALQGNLLLRQRGLADALEERSRSRYLAAREAQSSRELDPHLADVALHVALLLRAGERRAEAVSLLELAVQLYGPTTPRGRGARAQADALRAELEALYPEAGRR